jgi:hypothetical protein
MMPERQKAITRLAAMPWGVRKTSAAIGAVALAIAVAGCGSDEDKTIPPGASDQLIAQLQEVESQVSAGRCELAQGEAQNFRSSVDQLPAEVGVETKEELRELANNLVSLASDPDQCATEEGATGGQGVVPEETDTTTTEPTTTDTTTTEEEEPTKPEPEPEPAQPEPSQPEQQPSESQGQGSGEVGGALGGEGGTEGSTGGVKPKGER